MKRIIVSLMLVVSCVMLVRAQGQGLQHGVRARVGYSSFIIPFLGVGTHLAGGMEWCGLLRLGERHAVEFTAGVFTTGYNFKESGYHFVSLPIGAKWRGALWSSLRQLHFHLGAQVEVQVYGVGHSFFSEGRGYRMPLAFRTKNLTHEAIRRGNTWPIVPGLTMGLSYTLARLPIELGLDFAHDIMVRHVHLEMDPLDGLLTGLNYFGFSATYRF